MSVVRFLYLFPNCEKTYSNIHQRQNLFVFVVCSSKYSISLPLEWIFRGYPLQWKNVIDLDPASYDILYKVDPNSDPQEKQALVKNLFLTNYFNYKNSFLRLQPQYTQIGNFCYQISLFKIFAQNLVFWQIRWC